MKRSVLTRYLDPESLGRLADWQFEPRDLVIGNLAGAHKSPLAGFAVEFAGHREYVPGDDPKHVDWRVYFRREKYFVKQYELETNLTCHLVLDVSASMRYGEGTEQKLFTAARLATMLGYWIVRRSDKVSLATFDRQVRGFVPPSNSLDQMIRMAEHLDQQQPVGPTQIGACLAELAGRLGRREIVMVFSDFLGDIDDLESALQRLRYDHHEVVFFQLLHHDELTLELDGMTKFVGLEVDDQVVVEPRDLRRGYLAALSRFRQRLQDLAERNRCELVLVDTRRAPGEVLIDYLNHRSRQ